MPMQREYPSRPWVGIGVVVWRGDHVLLVQRGRAPRVGQWGLPGGAQQLGETIYEGAVREVLEETSLVVTPSSIITAVDGISRDRDGRVEYHYTLVEVAADCASGDPEAGGDATDARWVPLDEVERWVQWDVTLRVIFMAADQRRQAEEREERER